MLTPILKLRRQVTAWVVATFLITPATGLLAAVFFNLVSWQEVQAVLYEGRLPVVLTLALVLVALYFWTSFTPLVRWAQRESVNPAPDILHSALKRFGRSYWGLYLLYALTLPSLYFLSRPAGLSVYGVEFLVRFTTLQLTVAVLMALPAYLYGGSRLGRLAAVMGLEHSHNSLKSYLLLLGAFIPLLGYSVLMEFYWLRTGFISVQSVIVWAVLSALTVLITLLAVRHIHNALAPVQKALSRSGATTHADLAQLRANSCDEIGILVQTLGRVFQRLMDQESHVRAVVDHAAEAIIVVDEQGAINTFNMAAEKLFGYTTQEVRGISLRSLLPFVEENAGLPACFDGEREEQGVHRDGRRIDVSVLVSDMEISGKHMYTYLVGDISARKAALREQQRAESQYRDLVEAAQDLVWTMNKEGYWTYINNAAKDMYGYRPDEMIGMHMSEFQLPELAEKEMEIFEEVLRGRELTQFETVHLDRDGKQHTLSFNAKAELDDQGNVIRVSGTARDISEKKAYEQQLTYQAEHDALTGLYNRRYFQQELERVVARVPRSGAQCAILYVDLDQFKYINDTLGHAAGDRLLLEISNMLKEHKRSGDLLARFGGDEFTLLLYDIEEDGVQLAAENFRKLFENYRFVDSGKSFAVTCSIGAAMIDNDTGSADEAMSHADLACNIAKSRGRNCVNLFNPVDRDKDGMAEDMGWAARVKDMLENDRFLLMYQPIIGLEHEDIVDYEVLMRMPTDDQEIILPGGFMPAAERFGLMNNVDRWMVKRAIEELASIHDQGKTAHFSINLSGQAFDDEDLLDLIREVLGKTGLNPGLITFEITETAAITKLSAATTFIRALKHIGCQFALDDFGSGFCSFSYLKNLPVDKIKIDGNFVQNLSKNPIDQAMVKSMNDVAHALGKQTIAEFVEDRATLQLLREYGVDFAQGNFVGKPQSELLDSSVPLFKRSRDGESDLVLPN